MATYTTPGVYIQDIKSGAGSITQASSTVGALIGPTRSGLVGVPQLISSYTEFLNLYANGLDTGFLSNSDLPYAVHGFFTNGGQKLYVLRTASATAKKATKTSTGKMTVTAKYEGAWGNDLTVAITKSADWVDVSNLIYDIKISLGSSDSVTIKEVKLANASSAVLTNSKAKNWISEFSADKTLVDLPVETIKLAGGVDGIDDLADTNFVSALDALDTLDDLTFVAIPGETSDVVNKGLIAYCDNKGLFPILDMPMNSTVKATKDYRKTISAKGGILAYPWGTVNDPLTNSLRAVPSCGHVMGVYARIINERGVHKVPAGVDAQVRGFVSTLQPLTDTNLGDLNSVGVVCITSRPNAGIVIWGARSLNSDSTMKYVSDILINTTIKKSLYNGTQYAIFEPNTETLWSSLNATCTAFLESLRLQGALKGSKEEAYYVVVDSSNNNEDSINNGELNIEIGYAPVKPAEFVIIKLAHSINS